MCGEDQKANSSEAVAAATGEGEEPMQTDDSAAAGSILQVHMETEPSQPDQTQVPELTWLMPTSLSVGSCKTTSFFIFIIRNGVETSHSFPSYWAK